LVGYVVGANQRKSSNTILTDAGFVRPAWMFRLTVPASGEALPTGISEGRQDLDQELY
jgi:hypothetical protein